MAKTIRMVPKGLSELQVLRLPRSLERCSATFGLAGRLLRSQRHIAIHHQFNRFLCTPCVELFHGAVQLFYNRIDQPIVIFHCAFEQPLVLCTRGRAIRQQSLRRSFGSEE
jgi:hypothetical protein